MDETRLNLSSVVELLTDACRRLHTARANVESARKAETEAINDVNAAQQELDRFMTEARAAAPHGTNWSAKTRQEDA